MRHAGLWKGLVLGFVMCMGLIGFQAGEALAVAGKDVVVTAGTILAGATVEFELNDSTTVTRQVDQQGQVELPLNVNRDTVRTCYRRDQTATGETRNRIECGWWLPAASAAAAAAGGSASDAGLSSPPKILGVDVILGVGGTTALGGTNATTTANVPGTQMVNGGLGGLTGFTGSVLARVHLPLDWAGPGGDIWGYFRWNQHADRSATGAEVDAHSTLGKDVSTTFKRGQDLEVGIGYSYRMFCDRLNSCQSLGVHAGASFQQNRITVSWDESGGGGRKESADNKVWKTGVAAGLLYELPFSHLVGKGTPFSAFLGLDFRYVPNMSVDGVSSTFGNFRYLGSVDPWEVTTWTGLGMAF